MLERRDSVDIYQVAMQMERDSEALYRELAERAADAGIKRICTLLAADEAKHLAVIKQMKEAALPQMTETAILSDAAALFAQIKPEAFDLEGMQVEVYQQAQEIERKSQEYYVELAQQVKAPAQKELVLKIAEEEKQHYWLLDHIIEFISRPQTWLEDAEFTHLEDY
jgi:rubrerythrin